MHLATRMIRRSLVTSAAIAALGTVAAFALSCRSAPAPRMLAVNSLTATSGPVLVSQAAAHAPLESVATSSLCVSSGKLNSTAATRSRVDVGSMRAVVAGDHSHSAELAFTYRGPSTTDVPLASGELRRQIGLKLRAHDSCNVVYVMWHLEPTPGLFVLVKHNAGESTHAACQDRGYETIKADASTPAPAITRATPHLLRADLEGSALRVTIDGALAWRGQLPAQALVADGPIGVRTDNASFDFELRVPGGHAAAGACPSR